MTTSIDFPNLGIHLANVGKSIDIHGFNIAYYGICIGIGMLLGILMAQTYAKKAGHDPEIFLDIALYGIILGVIGARAYYVAFEWEMYKDNLKDIFNLRLGGLGIYGGVLTAIVVIVVYAKIKKLPASVIYDGVAIGLPTGQMLGRWGNFFNREAFGEYTDGLFAMRIPVDVVRNRDITDMMRENMQTIDGIDFIQVTPTYLYESVLCLCIVIFLLLFIKHRKFDGQLFLFYSIFYGAGRFLIEGTRTDSLYIPVVGIKVSQLVAVCLITAGVVLMAYNLNKVRKNGIHLAEGAVLNPEKTK
ncbi:MAG: prolipoprotein diacylglyceryl transferase [Dorea sp.]|nr:prolipoprotein diacylglyceryl transferase [Dorea sp.]